MTAIRWISAALSGLTALMVLLGSLATYMQGHGHEAALILIGFAAWLWIFTNDLKKARQP